MGLAVHADGNYLLADIM